MAYTRFGSLFGLQFIQHSHRDRIIPTLSLRTLRGNQDEGKIPAGLNELRGP